MLKTRRGFDETLAPGAFVMIAAMTFAQAWSMTHYQPATARSTRLGELSGWGKARLLFCGPTIRRQSNTRTPRDFGLAYETRHFAGAMLLRTVSVIRSAVGCASHWHAAGAARA